MSESVNSTDKEDVEKQDTKQDTFDSENQMPSKTGSTNDPNIVDWDGSDDPENPMNWPTSKKIANIGLVSLITLLSPLASTIISPATDDVMSTFHSTNQTLGAFVTSVYLLGYFCGPLILAPLSEIYGRVIIYNICNFLFLIFNVACALAPSLNALIVFRVFAGVAASCPMTLGAGTIADLVPVEKRGLALVSWIMGPVVGPTAGPLAGGYLAQAKGWRWIFWLISIMAGAVLIVTVTFMRETYAYVILEKKTNAMRKKTGNPHLRSVLDTGRDPKELLKFSIIRPLKMLALSPIVFIMSLYQAAIYGYMYLLFTTFPRVFQGQYGFSSGGIGLTYLGSGIGCLLGLLMCGAASDRLVVALTKRYGGSAKPEYRLPVMFPGSLLVPIGLFVYGWTADKNVQWIVPIIGTAIFGVGMFSIFMPSATYLVDAFTVYAASAAAASTVVRSLLGALLPLAGNSMYNKLGVGWGTSLLGFISVAFVPVPFLLWTFGERIRKSNFTLVNF